MSASLFRRRRRSSKVRFTPPNPSEAQQWLTGAEEDNPSFPDYKYLPDKLGGGAYGLHDLTQSVVPVAIADSAVGNFDGYDYILSNQIPSEFAFDRSLYLHIPVKINEYDEFRIIWNLDNDFDGGVTFCSLAFNSQNNALYFQTRNSEMVLFAKLFGSLPTEITSVTTYIHSGTSIEILVNNLPYATSNIKDLNGTEYMFNRMSFGSRGPESQLTNFSGLMYDIVLGDRLIPIDEGTGNTIHDSNGLVFGTLVNNVPVANFWSQGIATKYNLNRHRKVTTAGFAGDEWLTTAEFAALHNNTTRFTSDSGLSVLRSLPYDDINTLDAGQIAKINRYMGR